MSDVVYLAWRYLAYHRLKAVVLVSSIVAIVYLPLGLNILMTQSARQLRSRAQDTPLDRVGPAAGLGHHDPRVGRAQAPHPASLVRSGQVLTPGEPGQEADEREHGEEAHGRAPHKGRADRQLRRLAARFLSDSPRARPKRAPSAPIRF